MRKLNIGAMAIMLGMCISFSPAVTTLAAECQHSRTRTEITKASGHDEKTHWTASTNTYCSDCGKLLDSVTGSTSAHLYTSSFATMPSCLLEGREQAQCEVCGYQRIKTYSATHDISDCDIRFQNKSVIVYDEIAKQAVPEKYYTVDYNSNEITVTGTDGFTGTITGICNHKITERVPVGTSGYNNERHWTAGWEDICSDCGEHLGAVSGIANLHELKEVKRTEPSCTKTGSVTKQCVCGFSKTISLPATHDISACHVEYSNGAIKVLDGTTLVQSSNYTAELKNGLLTITGTNGFTGIIRTIVKENNTTPSNSNKPGTSNKPSNSGKSSISSKPNTSSKPKLGAPGFKTKALAKKNKYKLSWNKQKCSGYQIKYSLNRNFKNSKIFTINKISKVIKLNGKPKKIFVKIRIYKTVNGKKVYSNWSSLKTVKIK